MSAVSLELCAGAVAGGPVPLERAGDAVVAYTDGGTIYLGDGVDEHRPQTRWAVIAQAALMSSGSLDRAVLRKVARHGVNVQRRYLALEVVRSCTLAAPWLPRGLVGGLAVVTAVVSSSATDSLRRARSLETIGEAPTWFGELRPTTVLRARAEPPGGHGADDRSAAQELLEEDGDDETEDAAEGERSRIMELLSSPMRNPLSEAMQRLLGMGRSSGEGPAGAELPIVGRRSGKVSSRAQTVEGFARSQVTMAGQLVAGATYPEWDDRRGRYRDDYCVVGEFDPAPDPESATGLRHVPSALVRSLARLGLAAETHRGETTGDGLDLTALVDLRVRVAAGDGGETSIYTSQRRTGQRLGVLVLLDATGSTAEEADGRKVFEGQRTLAHDLTSALDRLGVRVATYAFYSNGRRNVRFLHCKTFDERWEMAARRRLQAVAPSGFTRFGAALRHGTHVLTSRAGTEQQLLVVIGDGVAYDDGYESRYAVADSRRAIEEAAGLGVAVVGLSVSTIDHGEPIWSADQHRVVEGSPELAVAAHDLIGGALVRARRTNRPPARRDTTRSTHDRART